MQRKTISVASKSKGLFILKQIVTFYIIKSYISICIFYIIIVEQFFIVPLVARVRHVGECKAVHAENDNNQTDCRAREQAIVDELYTRVEPLLEQAALEAIAAAAASNDTVKRLMLATSDVDSSCVDSDVVHAAALRLDDVNDEAQDAAALRQRESATRWFASPQMPHPPNAQAGSGGFSRADQRHCLNLFGHD